jgi:hypothetical protein
MRVNPVAIVALVFCIAGPVAAQDWTEFASQEDRFSIVFPGQPTITETTFTSEFGAELPARVYSAEVGPGRYSVTVVDYSPIESILAEKAKACPPGAETCSGGSGAPGNSTGPGYSKADRQGAITYATWLFMQRDATITHLLWSNIQLVEGHQIQLTNNANQSRTYAGIFMHEDKLYIAEGTVPAGYPEPEFFRVALGFLDENGDALRYLSYYRNGFSVPSTRE